MTPWKILFIMPLYIVLFMIRTCLSSIFISKGIIFQEASTAKKDFSLLRILGKNFW